MKSDKKCKPTPLIGHSEKPFIKRNMVKEQKPTFLRDSEIAQPAPLICFYRQYSTL